MPYLNLKITSLLLALTVLIPCNANAEVSPLEGAGIKFLAIEGLIVAASYSAAEKPRGTGVTTALLLPYAAAMDNASSTTTKWLGVILAEVIAAYNIRADSDDTISRDDIVNTNVIGWNVFALTVGLSEFYTNPKPDRKSNLVFNMRHDSLGQSLQLSYRF